MDLPVVTTHTHTINMVAKTNRALELIEGWATHTRSGDGRPLPRIAALELIYGFLCSGDEAGWAGLAEGHREVMPGHPGEAEFDTSRTAILAALRFRIDVDGDDPFAALDDHQPARPARPGPVPARKAPWERDYDADVWCHRCEARTEHQCCCPELASR